jgi:hypothetical protein
VKLATVLVLLVPIACARPTTTTATTSADDASTTRAISVRVPSALRIARAIDSLSVEIDSASLASTDITIDDGMVLGVESDVSVFAQGEAHPTSPQRQGLSSSTTFDLGTSIWNEKQDGLPSPGKKYVAEMHLVLFETDVPTGHHWDPHAGNFKALWSRTLLQAEE